MASRNNRTVRNAVDYWYIAINTAVVAVDTVAVNLLTQSLPSTQIISKLLTSAAEERLLGRQYCNRRVGEVAARSRRTGKPRVNAAGLVRAGPEGLAQFQELTD
jgi:hypothetical protein